MDKAGFKCFTRICQALEPLLATYPDEPESDFLLPFEYSAVMLTDSSAESTPGQDYAAGDPETSQPVTVGMETTSITG